MLSKHKYLIVIGLFFSFNVAAKTNLGVRAQALGGAYRAIATANDTLFFNPAGMLKGKRASVDTDYNYLSIDREHHVTVSVVDSKTSSLGMGLYYSGGFSSLSSNPNTHTIGVSAAIPLINKMFSLGSSLYYLYDPGLGADKYRHFFNMDVGFLANLPHGVSFAIVLDHLLAQKGLEKPLGLSIAAAFSMNKVIRTMPITLSVDWSMNDFKSKKDLKHSVCVGFEYLSIKTFPLRIGFSHDSHTSHNHLSLGSGIIWQHWAIDVLYQQNLHVGGIRNFGFSFKYFV